MKTQHKINSLGQVVEIRPDGRFSESFPNLDFTDTILTEIDDDRFERWRPITQNEYRRIIRKRHPHLFKEVV